MVLFIVDSWEKKAESFFSKRKINLHEKEIFKNTEKVFER